MASPLIADISAKDGRMKWLIGKSQQPQHALSRQLLTYARAAQGTSESTFQDTWSSPTCRLLLNNFVSECIYAIYLSNRSRTFWLAFFPIMSYLLLSLICILNTP